MINRIDGDGDRLARLLTEISSADYQPGASNGWLGPNPRSGLGHGYSTDAAAKGLVADEDQAGNIWAWGRRRPAIVLGSHLDTVPNDGASTEHTALWRLCRS